MVFSIFQANKKAKSAEVNDNFAFISGNRLIAVNASTGAPIATFPIGDLTAITNGSLAGDILGRTGSSLKVYSSTGVLIGSVSYDSLLNLQDASQTQKGVVELATTAEVNAGTDTTRSIVPSVFAESKFNAVSLLSSQIASNAASIIFTGLDSSYSAYEFEYINVTPVNNGAALVMQFSTDGGSNWQNTNYLSDGTVDVTSSAASESQNNARGVNLGLSDAVPGLSVSNNATLGGINGWIKIFNPASTTAYKHMKFLSTNIISADGVALGTALGYGVWKSISAVNAVRFIFKAANSDTGNGNIASGTIKMRGYK